MNMPQPHTKNRPARWPSPVSGTIGSRDGWKDLIRMTQEPAMRSRPLSSQKRCAFTHTSLVAAKLDGIASCITQLACAQELAAKSGINTTNKQHGLI